MSINSSELRFGIEFAPEVVQADGNVQNLAWRICNAKRVLVSLTEPSMSEDEVLIWDHIPSNRIACPGREKGRVLSLHESSICA